VAQGQWLGDWANRIELEVDNTNVDSNLSDFPVLIYLSSSSGITSKDVTDVFDKLASDANRFKIAVTECDGLSQCHVEIERWVDADEDAWLWVKVPSVYAGTTTTLYLYYDSAQLKNYDYVGDTDGHQISMVVDLSSEGTYDTTHILRPHVLKEDDGTYKMWYGGFDGSDYRIIYCDSEDGLSWSNFEMVVDIGDEGTYDTDRALDPWVIKDGSTYKMWYQGYDGSNNRVIYCDSSDGKTWSNHEMVVDLSDEGTYDTDSAGCCAVIKDGATYKMWYSGKNAVVNYSIIYCTSSDGKSWTGHTLCFKEGAEGTYDSQRSQWPCVIKDGSTYKLWYGGFNGSNWRILYCASANGTSWSSHQLSLDINSLPLVDWNGVVRPTVVKDTDRYEMWYSGNAGPYRGCHTHSFDGIEWLARTCEQVWDDDFILVCHMAQDPSSGAADFIKDSTRNENHGQATAGMTSADLVDGAIGKAIDFDGSGDWIDHGDDSSLDMDDDYTLEAIIEGITPGVNMIVVGRYNDGAADGFCLYYQTTSNKIAAVHMDSGTYNFVLTLLGHTSGYQHIAGTFEAGVGSELWRNGVSQGTDNTQTSALDTHTQDFRIGAQDDLGNEREYAGELDEIRLSKIVRADEWIKATYYSNDDALITFSDPAYSTTTTTTTTT